MTLSSKVILPHAINLKALRGANLLKPCSKFRTNETLAVYRVDPKPETLNSEPRLDLDQYCPSLISFGLDVCHVPNKEFDSIDTLQDVSRRTSTLQMDFLFTKKVILFP
jgi:hypothetical protein